jgi:hypothetical protein
VTIRPVDLPRLRAELISWIGSSETAANLWATAVKRGVTERLTGPIAPADVDEVQSVLRGAEVLKLKEAELFYASSEMTELAVVAAATIPDFQLAPEDLPSRAGLIVFEDAPASLALSGHSVGIKAVSWGDRPGGGSILIGQYAERREAAPVIAAASTYRQPFQEPTLTYIHGAEASWMFGENQDLEREEYGPVLALILRSAWLLMQQPVTTVSNAEYKRQDRRRLERDRIEPAPVRVITLRRAKSSNDHSESDREYHHQWIVRGHWRQQYYPSRGVHRPVWIAPHIKGPEGAPMLGGEKVHAWVR